MTVKLTAQRIDYDRLIDMRGGRFGIDILTYKAAIDR